MSQAGSSYSPSLDHPSAETPVRLMHVYMPWSATDQPGLPAPGSKALCGHVRRASNGHACFLPDPRVCVVCADLASRIPTAGEPAYPSHAEGRS